MICARTLFSLHARGNRRDHGRSHLELILAVLDSVPPGDPVEVGVGRPDFALFSFSNTSSLTGQSSPALALAVMNCVPSGGLPSMSSTDGRSFVPASAASFD